jgi:hypothetical protein
LQNGKRTLLNATHKYKYYCFCFRMMSNSNAPNGSRLGEVGGIEKLKLINRCSLIYLQWKINLKNSDF